MHANARNTAARKLVALGQQYHPGGVPLQRIRAILEDAGLAFADQFILTGAKGRTTLRLERLVETPLDDAGFLSVIEHEDTPTRLALQWYQMPNGMYEVNAYFSQ